jgi:signal transduction histidine kinase
MRRNGWVCCSIRAPRAESRWRAALALLAALAALPAPAAPTEALELRAAVWMPADADGRPDATRAQRVTLPDELGKRGAQASPSFYRIDVALPQAPADGCALFFEGVRAQLSVEVNGEPVGGSNTPAAHPDGGWRQAKYFEVPRSALREGSNALLLRVDGPNPSVVSAALFGPREPVQRRFQQKLMATVVGPLIIGATVIVVALSVLLIWVYRPSETQYAYFGFGGLLWAGHTLWTLLPQPLLPLPHDLVWWNSVYMAFTGLLVMFCVRFTGAVWRRFERAIWAFVAAGPPVLYLAAAAGDLQTVALGWRAIGIATVLIALAIVVRFAWRRRDVESALLLVTGAVSALFAIHDWHAHSEDTQVNPTILVPYAGLLFVVLMTWILTRRMVLAYGTLEHVNEQLEARVSAKSRELEHNYRLLRDAERRQSALEERRGILQDMHDGIGTHLMVTMRSLEHGALSPQAAAEVIRDCIDELRLTIDALDQAEGDLAAILAHLRYRLGDKLRHAGVEVDWQVREVPHIRSLEGAGGRELMRIVQEALNNVLKHSGASRVTFETGCDAEQRTAYVSIRDNGCGIAAAPPAREGGAQRGLTHMQRRAEKIGARLRITPLAPGTEVRLELALGAS